MINLILLAGVIGLALGLLKLILMGFIAACDALGVVLPRWLSLFFYCAGSTAAYTILFAFVIGFLEIVFFFLHTVWLEFDRLRSATSFFGPTPPPNVEAYQFVFFVLVGIAGCLIAWMQIDQAIHDYSEKSGR